MPPATSAPGTSCAWARTRSDVRVADGTIEVDRGSATDPDATIETDTATFSALIWNDRDLAGALRDGDIAIEGDRRAAARFLEIFPQPQPAAPPA